jgi:hypothetical protein
VIRTVALGVVCLACLGAIAAAAKKSPAPLPAEVVFPIVAGSKADRLPLVPRLVTPNDAERVDIAYAPHIEAPSEPAAPQKAASPAPTRIVSRHWHDPHDRKFSEAAKLSASKSKPKSSADRAPKRVADAKECRSDGLDPLLRKLNLSPQCE